MSLTRHLQHTGAPHPTGSPKMGDDGTESSTLRWPGDLRTNVATDRHASVETEKPMGVGTDKDDRMSVQSDVISCTESEREPIVKSERRGGGAGEQAETGVVSGLDTKEEEPLENQLPEKAAQVFAPAVTVLHSSPVSPRESRELWEMESQKSPFLVPQGIPHHENQFDWEEDTDPSTRRCTVHHCLWRAGGGVDGVMTLVCPSVSVRCCCPPREVLKVGVSLMSAAMFFPFLVWGGYVFLPFDAPLLDGAPLRLVYTLRCSVFSVTPIILGEYTATQIMLGQNQLPTALTCGFPGLLLRLAGSGGLSAQVWRHPPSL